MRLQCSFDDGCAEDMRVVDLLKKYGINDAIFYIPSEWQSYNLSEGRKPLSYDDVQEIAQDFTIGSHSVTHRLLTRIPYEEAIDEIVDSRFVLEDITGQTITSFCPPRGYSNGQLDVVIAANYETCRSTLVGSITEGNPLWQVVSVHVAGKRRKDYEGTTWLNEAEKLLEEAVNTPDSLFSFFGHSWEISRYDAWKDFEYFLKLVSEASK